MIWFNPVSRMFDAAYRTTPPWDIGRPRKQFMELVRQGEISGPVLDIGCGTGENALFFAEQGLEVLGIDFAPRAIRHAERKAAKRGLQAQFRVQNALTLEDLGRNSARQRMQAASIPCPTGTGRSLREALQLSCRREEHISCSASATRNPPGTARGACRSRRSGSASVTAGPSIPSSQRSSRAESRLPDPMRGFRQ